jgi:DNA invertase Pin-like site-specific DNA recombinase
MLIGYGRVATDEQINTLQFAELRRAGCKKIYKETATGRDAGRPELEQCLGRLKDGDTLMVWRLDRLGASLRDLIEIVNVLASQKAGFVSITERFDTRTAAGRLVFPLFASLTQFERELLRERTGYGLAAARARGRLGGRKPTLSDAQATAIRSLWAANQLTKADIAARFGVSVSTIDRVVRPAPISKRLQAAMTPSRPPTKSSLKERK